MLAMVTGGSGASNGSSTPLSPATSPRAACASASHAIGERGKASCRGVRHCAAQGCQTRHVEGLKVTVLCALALAGAALLLGGCGGGDGTPARTTPEGLAVYTPDTSVVRLAPGPRFIIDMPPPEEGTEWRLGSLPADMGGVSLKGVASPDGAGAWTFETVGAGYGTLEFQQVPIGEQKPTDTITFEVTIS
jgi:hypothetical protein